MQQHISHSSARFQDGGFATIADNIIVNMLILHSPIPMYFTWPLHVLSSSLIIKHDPELDKSSLLNKNEEIIPQISYFVGVDAADDNKLIEGSNVAWTHSISTFCVKQ